MSIYLEAETAAGPVRRVIRPDGIKPLILKNYETRSLFDAFVIARPGEDSARVIVWEGRTPTEEMATRGIPDRLAPDFTNLVQQAMAGTGVVNKDMPLFQWPPDGPDAGSQLTVRYIPPAA